jgi:hypothetical protein
LDMMNIFDKQLIYFVEFDFELIQNQIQIDKYLMKNSTFLL